jgi:uncharacterized protein with GYD domain
MGMLFISLFRFKKKPTKEMLAETSRLFEQVTKQGGKILGFYWTLGRYDGMVIVDGPDEKVAMRSLLRFADFVSTETLVALPMEEAGKLVE